MANRRYIAKYLQVACWFALSWPAAGAAAETAARPSWEEVVAEAQLHFRSLHDHRRGDIVSASDIEPLFQRLEQAGWQVPEAKQILAAVPADDDFVVRSLRSDAGRRFMRTVAAYPSAYDRLYRLEQLPGGQQTIRDLIQGAGGYKMIRYLTTSSGGQELGNMLQNTPQGKDFNKSTGKLFTATQVLQRLQQLFEQT